MINTSKTPFLLLDSSLSTSVIMLHHNGKNTYHFFESMPHATPPFSHTIAKHTQVLINSAQKSYPDISLRSLGSIICGLGPGSYTGIRASLSFAEGLRCSLKIPLGGFCSLSCLSSNRPDTSNWPHVMDARSGGIYIAFSNEHPLKVSSDQLSKWAEKQPGLITLDPEQLKKRPELQNIEIVKGFLDIDKLTQKALLTKTSLSSSLSPYYLGKGHTIAHLP